MLPTSAATRLEPPQGRGAERRPEQRTGSDARALASAKRAPARKPGGAVRASALTRPAAEPA